MAERGRGARASARWDVARPRGVAWPPDASRSAARARSLRALVRDRYGGRAADAVAADRFGFGIVLYFTADREPALWAALGAGRCPRARRRCVRARTRPVAFPLLLGVAAAARGFAVVDAEERARSRIRSCSTPPGTSRSRASSRCARSASAPTASWCACTRSKAGCDDAPERVRLSVKKRTAPPVGAFVELKARLNPPLRPLRPGGYDFARDLYFQRIGATGFVLGAIKHAEPPAPRGAWLRYAADRQRHARRDRRAHPRRRAGRCRRDRLGADHRQARRDLRAGERRDVRLEPRACAVDLRLSHGAGRGRRVLRGARAARAVAGARACATRSRNGRRSRRSIAAFFYLLLSGAEVATQRAFIMTAIVLVGVMVDRAGAHACAISRSRRSACCCSRREAVVHPSFQMSFAATLALIAAYERGLPWTHGRRRHLARRARRAVGRARDRGADPRCRWSPVSRPRRTRPIHFHRLAPYGVLANLLAMPIVSVWVMPAGLLALVAHAVRLRRAAVAADGRSASTG